MLVLLFCVGAIIGIAIGIGIGWVLGRSGRRPIVDPDLASTSSEPSHYADIVDRYPIGVIVVDGSYRVTFRNSAARAFAGTHVGVLIEEAVDRLARAATATGSADEVLEMYGPPKSVFVAQASRLKGNAAVVFVQDVSERRRVEQVRTDFVANLSHELKTPVGAMSVLAETLEGETDPDVVTRLVGRLMEEADRATRTIDDLLELSRIELGGERVVELVAVADVVKGAVERVTELAAGRDIRISTLDLVDANGLPRSSVMIDGDRRQLVSAVGNLVENAVKYSEPGGTVQVKVRQTDDRVEIIVADQGVGIPQRDIGRIFERFYRVDRARSRETGGTGLGLSIVRHVATSHRGDVNVTSTEGEGSVFVLSLPFGTGNEAGESIGDVAADGAHRATNDEGVA